MKTKNLKNLQKESSNYANYEKLKDPQMMATMMAAAVVEVTAVAAAGSLQRSLSAPISLLIHPHSKKIFIQY